MPVPENATVSSGVKSWPLMATFRFEAPSVEEFGVTSVTVGGDRKESID